MKYTITLVILMFGLFMTSCKKDECPTCPPPTNEFNLKITVKNSNGSPKDGIRIMAWHYVPSLARWVAWSVYKCNILAKSLDTTRTILDSTYYLGVGSEHFWDASVGMTEPNGVYECNNTLRFPNIFDLPSYVDSKDSVRFVLTDYQQSMTFYKTIINGQNNIECIWNPTSNFTFPPPDTSSLCLTISFQLPEDARVKIRLFNLENRTYAILTENDVWYEGLNEIQFDMRYATARNNNCY